VRKNKKNVCYRRVGRFLFLSVAASCCSRERSRVADLRRAAFGENERPVAVVYCAAYQVRASINGEEESW
jgi:hypothetical protein